MSYEQVEYIAQERISIGSQVPRLNLINEFGGLTPAIDYLKGQLSLGNEARIVYYGYKLAFIQHLLRGINLKSIILGGDGY
jgi:ClpP class serine protease